MESTSYPFIGACAVVLLLLIVPLVALFAALRLVFAVETERAVLITCLNPLTLLWLWTLRDPLLHLVRLPVGLVILGVDLVRRVVQRRR